MPELYYLIGDATQPVKAPAMIIHCCNDAGGWGRGFVLALREKYPESEKSYRKWFASGSPQLGEVQFVQINEDICVANMIGQHGVKWEGKTPPVRYQAIELCLKKVYEKAIKDNLTVHGPRFGCVLAGGSWEVISHLIKRWISVDTYIYTIESQKDRWDDKYVPVS